MGLRGRLLAGLAYGWITRSIFGGTGQVTALRWSWGEMTGLVICPKIGPLIRFLGKEEGYAHRSEHAEAGGKFFADLENPSFMVVSEMK